MDHIDNAPIYNITNDRKWIAEDYICKINHYSTCKIKISLHTTSVKIHYIIHHIEIIIDQHSAIKHHFFHISFDLRKGSENMCTHTSYGTSIRWVTVDVMTCSKSYQMGVVDGRHCTENKTSENSHLHYSDASERKKKGKKKYTYRNRSSAPCIPEK